MKVALTIFIFNGVKKEDGFYYHAFMKIRAELIAGNSKIVCDSRSSPVILYNRRKNTYSFNN